MITAVPRLSAIDAGITRLAGTPLIESGIGHHQGKRNRCPHLQTTCCPKYLDPPVLSLPQWGQAASQRVFSRSSREGIRVLTGTAGKSDGSIVVSAALSITFGARATRSECR